MSSASIVDSRARIRVDIGLHIGTICSGPCSSDHAGSISFGLARNIDRSSYLDDQLT